MHKAADALNCGASNDSPAATSRGSGCHGKSVNDPTACARISILKHAFGVPPNREKNLSLEFPCSLKHLPAGRAFIRRGTVRSGPQYPTCGSGTGGDSYISY